MSEKPETMSEDEFYFRECDSRMVRPGIPGVRWAVKEIDRLRAENERLKDELDNAHEWCWVNYGGDQ
jgi:hypothetical protein